jgi:hypothetical protein
MVTTTEVQAAPVTLLRDGQVVGTFRDEVGAVAYIHRMHSFSFSHAILHEGYSMRVDRQEVGA